MTPDIHAPLTEREADLFSSIQYALQELQRAQRDGVNNPSVITALFTLQLCLDRQSPNSSDAKRDGGAA